MPVVYQPAYWNIECGRCERSTTHAKTKKAVEVAAAKQGFTKYCNANGVHEWFCRHCRPYPDGRTRWNDPPPQEPPHD
jgi:hypothetical protein